jgi:ELWxxDGT repeat protein
VERLEDRTVPSVLLTRDINTNTPDSLTLGGSLTGTSAVLGDISLFFADDGVHGAELWRSDGTPEGTTLVKDIRPGPEGSAFRGSPPNMLALNGRVYFTTSLNLWVSDGTEAGTRQVFPRAPGAPMFDLYEPVVFNGELYSRVLDRQFAGQLWRSDGTAAGTSLVRDVSLGGRYSDLLDLTVVNGHLYGLVQSRVTRGTMR